MKEECCFTEAYSLCASQAGEVHSQFTTFQRTSSFSLCLQNALFSILCTGWSIYSLVIFLIAHSYKTRNLVLYTKKWVKFGFIGTTSITHIKMVTTSSNPSSRGSSTSIVHKHLHSCTHKHIQIYIIINKIYLNLLNKNKHTLFLFSRSWFLSKGRHHSPSSHRSGSPC